MNKRLVKVAANFEIPIWKFVKAKDKVIKHEKDKAIFDSSEGLSYPAGHRPFRSPIEFSELDAVFDGASAADAKFEVNIARGSSRREAMAAIHRAVAKFFAKINAEANIEHLNSLKPLATRGQYYRPCEEDVKAEETNKVDDLDLQDPVKTDINQRLIAKRAEQLYSSVIEKIQETKEDEKKAKEKT